MRAAQVDRTTLPVLLNDAGRIAPVHKMFTAWSGIAWRAEAHRATTVLAILLLGLAGGTGDEGGGSGE